MMPLPQPEEGKDLNFQVSFQINHLAEKEPYTFWGLRHVGLLKAQEPLKSTRHNTYIECSLIWSEVKLLLSET